MRFIYFDEVKFHPPRQPYYWLGALSVDADSIPELEANANQIALELFGTSTLDRRTEFHAVDMVHGVHQFRGVDMGKRMAALEALLRLATDGDRVRRIQVRIDPSKMVRAHGWEEDAFMFLVERVQQDLVRTKSQGILIGDLDSEYADESVLNLSRYRAEGTHYHFGKDIDRLIDSVYFIPSHHSRLVQLADAYTYLLQLLESPSGDDNYPKARIRKFARDHLQLFPHSYKHWPTDDSWLTNSRRAA